MKRIFLVPLFLTLLSLPAHAETKIAVSCECSFYVNFDPSIDLIEQDNLIRQTILVYGERTDATKFHVENCVLEDGKVVGDSCWFAKSAALFNCQKEAQLINPKQVSYNEIIIDEDTCYGQIDKN